MSLGILSHWTLPSGCDHSLSYSFNSPPIKSISPVQKEECCGGPYYTTGHIQSYRSKHLVLRTPDGMQQCVWAFAGPWHLLTCWKTAFSVGTGHGSWALLMLHLLKVVGFKFFICVSWRAVWRWLSCASGGVHLISRVYGSVKDCCCQPAVLVLSEQIRGPLLICGIKLQMGGWSFSSEIHQLSSEILTLLSSPLLSLTHFWP